MSLWVEPGAGSGVLKFGLMKTAFPFGEGQCEESQDFFHALSPVHGLDQDDRRFPAHLFGRQRLFPEGGKSSRPGDRRLEELPPFHGRDTIMMHVSLVSKERFHHGTGSVYFFAEAIMNRTSFPFQVKLPFSKSCRRPARDGILFRHRRSRAFRIPRWKNTSRKTPL